jgi:hypothetical protein
MFSIGMNLCSDSNMKWIECKYYFQRLKAETSTFGSPAGDCLHYLEATYLPRRTYVLDNATPIETTHGDIRATLPTSSIQSKSTSVNTAF